MSTLCVLVLLVSSYVLVGSRHRHKVPLRFGYYDKTLAPFGCFTYSQWCQYLVFLQYFQLYLKGSSSAYVTCLLSAGYGLTSSLTCKVEVFLKHSIPLGTILYSMCIFQCCFCTCHSVAFPAWTCSKLVCFLFNFVTTVWIIFKPSLALDVSFFVCSLICLPLCWTFVVWLIMLSSCSHSQSDIPNNAGQFPDTTKKMHWYPMPLLVMVTLHFIVCGILLVRFVHIISYMYMVLKDF